MATGDIAPINNWSQNISNVASILELFKGKEQNSSQSQNQNTNSSTSEVVSPEKAAALLEQMLGSVNGLANVASGQKMAGGYDSTTNQLMINDLLSSTAGEIASRSSIKNTTANTVGTTEGTTGTKPLASVGGAAKVLGAVQAGSSLYNAYTGIAGTAGVAGASGGTGIVGSLSGLFGGGTAAAGATAAGTAAAGTAGTAAVGAAGTGAATGAAGAAGMSGLAATGWGALAAYGALNYRDIIKNGTKEEKIGTLVGGLGTGNIIRAIQTKDWKESLGPAKKLAKKWIICTELYNTGRLPRQYYIPGLRVFNSYTEQEKQGYYLWAIPSVQHLRANPYSTYSRFMCWIFNIRAEHMAAIAGVVGAKKTILGAVVEYVGRRACRMLGHFCATRNPMSIYNTHTATGE